MKKSVGQNHMGPYHHDINQSQGILKLPPHPMMMKSAVQKSDSSQFRPPVIRESLNNYDDIETN